MPDPPKTRPNVRKMVRMLDDESLDYLRRRELAERAAAKKARSETARRIHQELAQSYARRLGQS